MSIRRHIRFSSTKQRSSIKDWHGKMLGVPVFIIGNGPSLNDINVDLLNPFFSIGINRAFYKIDPTILMWQDVELWHTERKRVLRLSALKVCRNTADPQNRFFHFRLAPGGYKIPESPSVLYGRGSTGPLAVQFAYVLGCNPIILLGCDCEVKSGMTDFYGRNRHHSPNTMPNCRKGLEWIKNNIKDRKIYSCSDNKFFEKRDIKDVIRSLDPIYKQQRTFWLNKIV